MLKIAVIGPESTGKSTLAEALSKHFNVNYVAEFAREYLHNYGPHYCLNDIINIAIGQKELIEKEASKKQEILIADTELIVCKVWAEYVFGEIPDVITQNIRKQDFDLYLLCDIDIPWTYDPLRENPSLEERKDIFNLYINTLEDNNLNYSIIRGCHDQRVLSALQAIEKLRQ